jgi:hypothetical protein
VLGREPLGLGEERLEPPLLLREVESRAPRAVPRRHRRQLRGSAIEAALGAAARGRAQREGESREAQRARRRYGIVSSQTP